MKTLSIKIKAPLEQINKKVKYWSAFTLKRVPEVLEICLCHRHINIVFHRRINRGNDLSPEF